MEGGENMIAENTIRLVNKYSDEILEIVDNRDEFTRSDLQGIIDAIVLKILKENK